MPKEAFHLPEVVKRFVVGTMMEARGDLCLSTISTSYATSMSVFRHLSYEQKNK